MTTHLLGHESLADLERSTDDLAQDAAIWQTGQRQDEFSQLINQPLQIQLVNNQKVQGTLLRNGAAFLLLQAGEQQLLVNKQQILQVSLPPHALPPTAAAK